MPGVEFTTICVGSDGKEYDKGQDQHLPDHVFPRDAFMREVGLDATYVKEYLDEFKKHLDAARSWPTGAQTWDFTKCTTEIK